MMNHQVYSVAKRLIWDGLLHYKFVVQFAGERTFKIGEHSAKLQAKWAPILSSKMQNSTDK